MIVVFIRHGTAEKAKNNDGDAQRALTPDGREKITRAAAGIARLLSGSAGLFLWSSPLVRARQTAEILAEQMGLSKPVICAFLTEQSWDSTAAALLALPADACVLLVGHEPMLGVWCEDLCGAHLPFRRGAAAAVKLPEVVSGQGELLWFLQPRALRRIGEGHKDGDRDKK